MLVTAVGCFQAVYCVPMPEFQDAIAQFAMGLPSEAVTMLASMIQQYSVPSQISILDELPDTVIFVISGLITSYLLLKSSNVIELSQHGPGAVLGLGEVLNREAAGLRAISRESCVLGLIPGHEFRRFLHDWPSAYITVTKVLSSELQNAYCQRAKHLGCLVSSTPPDRTVQPS